MTTKPTPPIGCDQCGSHGDLQKRELVLISTLGDEATRRTLRVHACAQHRRYWIAQAFDPGGELDPPPASVSAWLASAATAENVIGQGWTQIPRSKRT